MKYLRKFNEAIMTSLDKIKSEIDDVSYILEDENLNVRSFRRGSEYVVINIINPELNTNGFVNAPGYVPTPTRWDKRGYLKRSWLKSLAFNDAFVEFIDRVDEICKKNEYVIFVNGCSSRFKGDDEIVKYYNFDEMYIGSKNRPFTHIETFIDVKKAIRNEHRWAYPGKIDKGIKWINKNIVYPAADLIGI